MGEHLDPFNIKVETFRNLELPIDADILLIQHHWDLFSNDEIRALCIDASVPVVLLSHEPGVEIFDEVDGFISFAPNELPFAAQPVFCRVLPSWTPPRLTPRVELRSSLGLPLDALILGTNGFVRFERQWPTLLRSILPATAREGWFVELVSTPWREPSPGLLDELDELDRMYPDCFRYNAEPLSAVNLNYHLQACDLLWSWTRTESRPYASGAVSDQYASGTRVFAAAKDQYAPILKLPNSVAGPEVLPTFTDALIAEARRCANQRRVHGEVARHDPAPVSWDHFAAPLASFLRTIYAAGAA